MAGKHVTPACLRACETRKKVVIFRRASAYLVCRDMH